MHYWCSHITFVKALRGAFFTFWTRFGNSGAQHGQQRGNGAAAMAERVLGFEIEFGHGAVERGQVEERVVAEAAGAARALQGSGLRPRPRRCAEPRRRGRPPARSGSARCVGIGERRPAVAAGPCCSSTSVLSLASGESTRPASAAKRAERTPGAPSRASTSRPESSARTSSPGAKRE
jgi:hypothetical protein